MTLPTFLVGWGGPTVEEGIAVSNNNASSSSDFIASELSNYGNSSEYHSYLLDARNAVRYNTKFNIKMVSALIRQILVSN